MRLLAILFMAIFNFSGPSTGLTTGGEEYTLVAGTLGQVTSPIHTSEYSMRVNPTTTGTGQFEMQSYAASGGNNAFSLATLYVGFHFRYAVKPAANDEEIFISLDNTSAYKFSLRLNSSGNLAAYDQATALMATGSTALAQDTWYHIKIQIGTGASASWEVQIAGATEISGTGDLKTTNNNRVSWGKRTNRNGQTVDLFFTHLVLDDAAFPPTGAVVAAMMPDSTGNYNAWTPTGGPSTNWEAVDERPISNTDYALSDLVIGDAFTVGLESAASAGINSGDTVHAVKAFTRALRDSSPAGTMQMRLRSATTDNDTTNFSTGATAGTCSKIYTTDPATGAAWTVSALDSIEVGAEEAETSQATRVTSAMAMVCYTPAVAAAQPRDLAHTPQHQAIMAM